MRWPRTPIRSRTAGRRAERQQIPSAASFTDIIELLRTTTPHDFTLYKPGTLQRRIERRMAMAGAADLGRYLSCCAATRRRRAGLPTDLLINVTSFFRDPKVFERLAADIIPDLIRGHDASQPLRVWVAGCSTGEETWSLAMLFREQLDSVQFAGQAADLRLGRGRRRRGARPAGPIRRDDRDRGVASPARPVLRP